jgi:hypothetical protein
MDAHAQRDEEIQPHDQEAAHDPNKDYSVRSKGEDEGPWNVGARVAAIRL